MAKNRFQLIIDSVTQGKKPLEVDAPKRDSGRLADFSAKAKAQPKRQGKPARAPKGSTASAFKAMEKGW